MEELRSRRSRTPGDEVEYEMAYSGWTSCGRDLRNGLHEVCVQASVFAKEIGRNWRRVHGATVQRGTVAYGMHMYVLCRAVCMDMYGHRCMREHACVQAR